MAFFGINSSNDTSFQFQPIIGLSANVLVGVYDAKFMANAARQIDKSEFDAILNNQPAVTAPWEIPEDSKSLVTRINEVRNLTNFIDLTDPDVSIGETFDKQATFAIFKALDNIRVLAQYAAESTTPTASLSRLNDVFQNGLGQIRDFLSDDQFDKLELLLGDKKAYAESAVRTGKASTTYTGSTVTAAKTDIVSGITGTEVFTVTLTKNGVSDDFTVDLNTMTDPLTLENIVTFINTQIEALPLLDEFGDPVLDEESNPVSKYLTRFETAANADGTGFTIQIASILTEDVKLSSATADPALYVTGNLNSSVDDDASTALLTKITGVTTTLTEGSTTNFAGIDRDATEVNIETLKLEEEDDELDPKIAELKAKLLAESAPESDEEEEEVSSSTKLNDITDLANENMVHSETTSSRAVVDSEGNIYVIGQSKGSFDAHINVADTNDVFLTKFDSEGNVIFSRLMGASDDASGFALTIDSADNVIIAGQTNSDLTNSDNIDGKDAFVAKYSARGDQVFLYQLDTAATTSGLSVTVDANDDIILGGQTFGALSATSGYSGSGDGMLLKLNGADGTLAASTVFGGAQNEAIKAIEIASDGNIVVAMEIDGNAVIKKFDATDLTTEMFSIDLGALSFGSIEGMVIEGTDIYLAGTTQNAALDSGGTATIVGAAAGGYDGFIASFSDAGSSISANSLTYLGTAGTDSIADIAVNAGKIYVAGTTNDDLGEGTTGSTDGFVARIDGATGLIEDSEQFGTYLNKTDVSGIAFAATGDSVLSKLGLPMGTVKADETFDIQTQTNVRQGDHFFIAFDGGSKKKITIDDGDTFDDIARKIRVAGFRKVVVTISGGTDGDRLKISAIKDGVSAEIFAGKGDQDALSRLGMKPMRLIPSDTLFDIGGDDDVEKFSAEDLGGVFALELEGALHINDKLTAKYVLNLLDGAIDKIQRASRSLIFDPIKADLLRRSGQQGQAPAHITARIANYQDALFRLQSMTQSSSSGFF